MKNTVMIVAALGLMLLSGCFPHKVELAKGGVPRAEIVIGEKASTISQFAARELKVHLDALTGGDFAIVSTNRTAGMNALYVGPESLPAELREKFKAEFDALAEQEHAIVYLDGAVVFAGHDVAGTAKPRMTYCGTRTLETQTWCCNWPNIFTQRGTLNAVYDFLHNQCGVSWLDPYESGTVLPHQPDLTVEGTVKRDQPFVRCRNASGFNCGRGSDGCLWSGRLYPQQREQFYRAAFPETYARKGIDVRGAIGMQENLFVLRMMLGGENIGANHSFYWWYDRFLMTNNVNFIAYHPEYFSKHRVRRKAGQGEQGSFGAFDTSRSPAQLCYSNPDVIRQAVIDVRAYFDVGGYTNRYTNQGATCDAKHPVATWGKNVCCLEPMDNGSFCECDACLAQYDKSRANESAVYSDYWFRFVNKVAKEIKKSHPGKFISTLAYGTGREGLPSFPLEDNIVVHFCWDSNRGPNREPLMTMQKDLMRKWRAAYPKNEFGLWLYNTFPYELMHANQRSNSFPGFFGQLLTDEYRFIRDLNMRECIFNCGWADEFENFLSARYMWNPSADYQQLKDEFFSAYGPAEKPIREFYDIVEARYCNPSNFVVKANGRFLNSHMTREISWGCLGTEAVTDRLEELMDAAELAVQRGTPQERNRVRLWKLGIWNYMKQGFAKTRRLNLKSNQASVVRTDYLARTPRPLEGNFLKGRPLNLIIRKNGTETVWGGKKPVTVSEFTDGNYGTRNIMLATGKDTELLHVVKMPVKKLSRLRINLQMDDGLRYQAFFRPVGLVNGKWIDLGPEVKHNEYCGGFSFPGTQSVTVYEYTFNPWTVPDLEGIGFVNRDLGFNYPSYCQVEAATAAPTEVLLPAGDVVLDETKVLDASASGKVFKGADDGSTRITAGIAITNWTDRGNGVWAAKLPLGPDGKPIFTETLFVNGRRAKRSRWPNQGYFHVTSVSQTVCKASATGHRHTVGLKPAEAKLLSAVPADELKFAQFIVHVKWDAVRYPIQAFADSRLTVDAHALKNWNWWSPSDLYALENVRSAFDEPGEWFYDAKAGEVLYRPLRGEKLATTAAVAPRDGLETLLAIKGANNVIFDNVTFAENAPVSKKGPTALPSFQAAVAVSVAAVTVDQSQNVVFRNCRFNRLGSYGVWFREGCKGGGVYDCEFTDLGAGGVRIGVADFPGRPPANQKLPPKVNPPNVPRVCTAPWMTSRITVDNCLIADGGRFHPAGEGVWLAHASDCKVTHNEIRDLYYTGVSVGWIWGYAGSVAQRNEISFNHIHDIGKAELADMGGIYTLGTSFGTVLSNNVIHAIHTYSYGGWGLYPDEGSQGIVLENNLVYDTDDASFHQHFGIDNVLRNNILVDSKMGQIAVTRAEPHRSLTAERNLVLWTKGDAFNRYAGTKNETAKIDWRSNLWWRTDGKDVFNSRPFTNWCARVKDQGSVFADPKFANWKKRDFRLPPDSPALKLGFKPFDPSLAGRRK